MSAREEQIVRIGAGHGLPALARSPLALALLCFCGALASSPLWISLAGEEWLSGTSGENLLLLLGPPWATCCALQILLPYFRWLAVSAMGIGYRGTTLEWSTIVRVRIDWRGRIVFEASDGRRIIVPTAVIDGDPTFSLVLRPALPVLDWDRVERRLYGALLAGSQEEYRSLERSSSASVQRVIAEIARMTG